MSARCSCALEAAPSAANPSTAEESRRKLSADGRSAQPGVTLQIMIKVDLGPEQCADLCFTSASIQWFRMKNNTRALLSEFEFTSQ